MIYPDIIEIFNNFNIEKINSLLLRYTSKENEENFLNSIYMKWKEKYNLKFDYIESSCISDEISFPYYPLNLIIGEYFNRNNLTINEIKNIIDFKNSELLGIISEIEKFISYKENINKIEQINEDLNLDQIDLQISFMEKIFLILKNIVPEEKPVVMVLRDLHLCSTSTINLLLYLLRSIQNPGILFILTVSEKFNYESNYQKDNVKNFLKTNKYEKFLDEYILDDDIPFQNFYQGKYSTDKVGLFNSSGWEDILGFLKLSSDVYVSRNYISFIKYIPKILDLFYNYYTFPEAIKLLKNILSILECKDYQIYNNEKLYIIDKLLTFYWISNQYNEYERLLLDRIMLYKSNKDQNLLIKYYRNLSYVNIIKQDFPKALKYIENSFKLCQKNSKNEFLAELYYLYVIIYYPLNNKKYEYYFSLCEEQCKKMDNKYFMARLYLQNVYIASLSLNISSIDKAIELIEVCYKISNDLDNLYLKADVWINYAHINKARNKFISSINFYEKAIDFKKNIGDVYSVFQLYNSIGFIYFLQGDFDKAIEYYQQGLFYGIKTGDIMEISLTYLNIGDSFMAKGDFSESIIAFEKCLELKKDIPNVDKLGGLHGLPKAYNSFAISYIKNGKIEKSKEYLNLCEKYLTPSNFDIEESRYIYCEALISAAENNFDDAVKFFEESILKCSWSFYRAEILREFGLFYRKHGLENESSKCFFEALEIYEKGSNFIYEKNIRYLIENPGFLDINEDKNLSEVCNHFSRDFVEKYEKANFEIMNLYKKINHQKKDLEDANSKLKEWDKIKTDLFASISHDFRSPLTVILNKADLELKFNNQLDEKSQKSFQIIYNSSLKLKSSIDKLLDIARMDTKGLQLQVQNVNVKKLLNDVLDYYISAVSDSEISIEKEFPEKEINDFYTDKAKLEDIINNILSNAIKYVDAQNGIIKVKIDENTPGFITISIIDNGIGIPPEKIDVIFERFEQVEQGRNSIYKGTGIGLAFAKQLSTYLNANIYAQSDGIGKGATFKIEIPRGRSHFREDDFIEILQAYENHDYVKDIVKAQIIEKFEHENVVIKFNNLNGPDEYDYKKGKFLIVDDNKNIRDILMSYLVNDGYSNFILASNGKDALNAAYKYLPDFIICDYNMPILRGDAFHDELSSNPKFNIVPFVFLSAVVDNKVILERKGKGAIAYLNKPIDPENLLVTVEVHLKKYMDYLKALMLATVDELTGLNNQRSILKILNQELSKRELKDLSILFFDIDHFKNFNDQYGHQLGDKVLSSIGTLTRDSIRKYDYAGRYGGEEFLVILPGTSIKKASILADKLRVSIENLDLLYNSKKLSISASFGIASLIDNSNLICKFLNIGSLDEIYNVASDDDVNWEKVEILKNKISTILVKIADDALYKAKRTFCSNCGYSSVDDRLFRDSHCPSCGSINVINGRNKIVLS